MTKKKPSPVAVHITEIHIGPGRTCFKVELRDNHGRRALLASGVDLHTAQRYQQLGADLVTKLLQAGRLHLG